MPSFRFYFLASGTQAMKLKQVTLDNETAATGNIRRQVGQIVFVKIFGFVAGGA
jgi:hypothetical protein